MPSLSTDIGSFDRSMCIFQIIITDYLPCSLSFLILIALSLVFARTFTPFAPNHLEGRLSVQSV
jgi:hypothetical protein